MNQILVEAYKEIPLVNSDLFAIVDERDYNHLMQWEWKLVRNTKKRFYAFRSCGNKRFFMHREIFRLHDNEFREIRHINGNTLDNRLSNLKGNRSITKKKQNAAQGDINSISPRQREVLELISQGFTNEQVAQKLYISKVTVDSHLTNVYKCLNVHTRNAAIYKLYGTSGQHILEQYSIHSEMTSGQLKKELKKHKSQRLLAAQCLSESMKKLHALYKEIDELQEQVNAAIEFLKT